MNIGRVVQVAGPVVDVEFPGALPPIYNALTCDFTVENEPVSVTLEYLPIGEIRGLQVPGAPAEESLVDITEDTVFEPDAETVLSYLIGQYLNIFLYYTLLHAKASEQSARMVSMKNATDAAEDLIRTLTLEYNKLRQGNITKELLEIAGGQAQ